MARILRAAAILALALLGVACNGAATPTPERASVGAPLPPVATYAAGSCHARGDLPDATCTPGAVQPGVTAATLCAPGYTTRTVRPPVSYTDALKRSQMAAYGYTDGAALHEEDHLIPLELGGNPTDPRNLWPQPHAGNDGAPLGSQAKDATENATKKAVCAGKMDLLAAQTQIAADWTLLYRRYLTAGLLPPVDPKATEGP